MKLRFFLILLAAPVASAAVRDAGPGVEQAIRDLGSPFLEARRRAVDSLIERGDEGCAAMRAAYGRADFRTKVLILDGFAKGRPKAGIELVFADLATPDRATVLAQRRLLTALYLEAARYASDVATTHVGVGDWRAQEGLRALPGPGPRAREGLRVLRASTETSPVAVGSRLSWHVDAVDRAREKLGSVAQGETGLAAERARGLLFGLVRLDTERALIAAYEVSGREGSFDGMYAVVGELVARRAGRRVPPAIEVLMAILEDRPPAEEGVPSDRRRHYAFLSPVPPDGDALTLRRFAASCLGEVGDGPVGDRLVKYFGTLTWNSNESWQEDEETALIDDDTTPKLAVAVACAELGRKGPLSARVKYLEDQLRHWFYGSALERRILAMAYARLGEFGKAAAQYEYCLQETPRDGVLWYNLACALARSGDAYRSLQALRKAVASGYGADPSQVAWAHRDRDLEPVRKLAGFGKLFGKTGTQGEPERAGAQR